jgi:hypothetical protein
VAPDGATLVAKVDVRNFVRTWRTGESSERDLSWLEQSVAVDLSADGKKALLRIDSERETKGSAVFLRSMDGSAPVRLGDGNPQELSRDGKWALALRGGKLVALPTAAGKERMLEATPPMVSAARWMPDGVQVLVVAKEPSGRSVASVMSFEGGPARIVGNPLDLREGSGSNRALSPVSPDGRFVAAAVASGQIVIVPLDGGEARPLPGTGPNDVPVQWTPDGRQLFVLDVGRLPAKVYKTDLATGRRVIWREIQPADRVGVSGVSTALVTPDGATCTYSYMQFRSDLYVVRGLR